MGVGKEGLSCLTSLDKSQGNLLLLWDEAEEQMQHQCWLRLCCQRPLCLASQTCTSPPQINAEKSPFLVDRLKVWMLPTLALIRLQKTVDYVAGFDQLGGKDDFSTEVSLI